VSATRAAAAFARPLWWEDVDLPAGSDDDLPPEADAVVVGGGYTGVTAARELARRGRTVVVLEKEQLGYGASTRNAGFVHPGLKASSAKLEARGPPGRALLGAGRDAFALLERLIAEARIDCDFRRDGRLVLAHSEHALEHLRELQRTYRDGLHEHARLVPRAELPDVTAASGFHGALEIELGATLQPAKYYAGLARAAEAAGAQLYARSPATSVERLPAGGFRVGTPRGTVEARDVLVATNGYTGSLFPELRRRVIPIGSFIVATERLDEDRAALVSPPGSPGRALLDTRNFLHYWRLSSDSRLVFGGRASFRRSTDAWAADVLEQAMLSIYPQLRGVRIEYSWSGNVAFTFDRLPHFGRVRGVTFALGYCGSGVGLSTYFGTLAGAWIAGEEPPAFAGMRFPTAPLYRGTPWFLPAIGLWYQLLDHVR
jgi:glycine/D-amino acid oxidase-like deaminating enzyme